VCLLGNLSNTDSLSGSAHSQYEGDLIKLKKADDCAGTIIRINKAKPY
jgi:hypothetical protein